MDVCIYIIHIYTYICLSILIHVLVDVCIRMSSKYALYICMKSGSYIYTFDPGGNQPNVIFNRREFFKYWFDPAAQDLEEFWSHEVTTEWFKTHPILQVTWRGLSNKCHRVPDRLYIYICPHSLR